MPRYVVLFHQLPDGSRDDHWDFMLESESSLLTWALAKEPNQQGDIPCQLLKNHRIHFLPDSRLIASANNHVAATHVNFVFERERDGLRSERFLEISVLRYDLFDSALFS